MNIEIIKIENNTPLKEKLLKFVEDFSWEEVKGHTLKIIRDWYFSDWEAPFIAVIDGKIIGMATIMKEDYYPLPEIYPWVSTIFVSEENRGNRVSEKLIAHLNGYAKSLGFDKTYIPSEHIGLYEKYGYHYLKDIVNFGNGTDRLYVKYL